MEISEQELRKYVVIDEDGSKAFSPALKINPDEVDDGGLEADIALSVFNGWSRRRRQRKYRSQANSAFKVETAIRRSRCDGKSANSYRSENSPTITTSRF